MDPSDLKSWRKSERARLIAARLAVPAAERKAAAEAIAQRIEDLGIVRSVQVLSFYWPMKGELDFRGWVKTLHARGVKLALPVVIERGRPMVFRPWAPGAKMERGIWNIPQPAARETIVPDVVLAPVVGFDGRSYRLGYGGGYFDRTLASLTRKPFVVGVGLELQGIATIHPQVYDVRLDRIITEQSVTEPPRTGP